jgi:hypothetical protein
MAVEVGVRAAICAMDVPSLMRDVCAPIQASGVKASEPQASALQAESQPSFSASWASSTRLGSGCAPQ